MTASTTNAIDPAIAAMRGRAFAPFTVALWVVVVALLGGSAAALSIHKDKPPTASQVVSRAVAFVKTHPSAAFTGHLRAEATDRPGSSQSSVVRFQVEGVSHLPDRARLIASASDGAAEVIAIGTKQFVRQADSKSALAKEKYSEVKADDTNARNGIVGNGPGSLSDNADRLSAPNGLGAVLAAARRPVIVSHRAGVNVVRAPVTPSLAFGALGGSIKQATLVLTAGDDGTVDRTALTLIDSQANVSVDYRWSRWGENVVIETPGAAEIDATPGIYEERVAAFNATPLYQPQALPKGWVLDGADVLGKDETPEGCDEVEVDYTDPTNADAGFLTMIELPASCSDPTVPPGANVFVAGPYRGFAQVDQGETDAQFAVGRTVIQVQTDLTPSQLSQVMAHLVALDLGKAPLPISGLGKGTTA